jgi:cytochrome c-type biogenesis protein CcmH/NrfF
MEEAEGILMVHKIISVKKIAKSEQFGDTWKVVNLSTGQEFTIDQFPKRDRCPECANYIVEQGNTALAKFMTFRGAKQFIEEQR